MTEEKVNGNGKRWRFDTTVSLPMVAVFCVQTLAFTWFLAIQSKSLTDVVGAVAKAEATAYTKTDAAREREFQAQVTKNTTDKLDELTRRLAIVEIQATRVK